MKLIDVVQLTRDAIGQTMGADYEPIASSSNDELMAMPSHKLADIGRDVTSDTTINSLTTNLISLMGKHIIESRRFVDKIKTINVDSFDWGGFIQRTRIGLGEIMDDPMYAKTVGRDYSSIEHTYYGQDVKSKIYGEAKSIMTPISIEREELREAFTSWDKLNAFISAKMTQIENTIKLAIYVYKKMLFSCAIATSDLKTQTAVHLISEAVALGILSQVNEGTESDPELRNPTYEEVRRNSDFLKFCCERIAETRDYMMEISEAFNDGSIPTWCDETPRFEMLADFEKAIKFNVKADTYHPDQLGFGEYETISSWQGIKDSTSREFDPMIASKVMLSADSDNKLGIGTSAYTKAGVVGLMFDPMAIGCCLYRNKVTSSYTASADFWNEFHHTLVNYLIDSSYSMVAFIMD